MDIYCRATGVTFAPGYPRNLADLQRRCQVAPVELELVRDVENHADLNAVSLRAEGRHLGWVPADFTAWLAPQLDRGVAWTARAMFVAVDVAHRERPGLAVQLSKAPSGA